MMRQFIFACFLLLTFAIQAKENIPGGPGKRTSTKANKITAACVPSTSRAELDVNNIRTTLLGGGDLWWDLQNARYEIPKVPKGSSSPKIHSLFAGALWIGGIDAGGQLKIAAQTYRQTGDDFWPGPLDNQGNIDDVVCSSFDKHWKVNSTDIDLMIALGTEFQVNQGGQIPENQIPNSVLEWPGAGNPSALGANNIPLTLSPTKPLAPYVDVNADGVYDPRSGDYPDVKGDQAIWWIYNDKGNTHTETGGEAIGIEVQALAFGFATNDEINDMTFYQYKVRNFSTSILDSVYFGQWVDPDLGKFDDDYVGSVPDLALGIVYNGDENDEGASGYGVNPPLLGVDFFQGPKKFIYDASGSIVDSVQLGMSKFIYYNNDFSTIGNPQVASHFYGYLSGTWKDGSPITVGGNGYGGTDAADFMFPNAPGSGGWSECDEGNTPADRRFIQSSGAFRLDPGAQNSVVVGVVWVRPSKQVGCNAEFQAIISADQKAQALFDNNFKLIDGPDAPNLVIRELNKELIITITNTEAPESYNQTDPIVKSIIESYLGDTSVVNPTNNDSTYTFQGYQIYQLANSTVSPSEFNDVSKARLIAQYDIRDNIEKLINYEFDQETNSEIGQVQVVGNNSGIKKSFQVTADAFGSDVKNLVNNKAYFFSVIAYSENNYLPYDLNISDPILRNQMQRKPYLAGRRNIKVYQASPHIPAVENKGSILNSVFGESPEITKLDGKGNGNMILELSDETVAEILTNGFTNRIKYRKNFGPISVKVIDPVKIIGDSYRVIVNDKLIGTRVLLNSTATWALVNSKGDTITSKNGITRGNEIAFPELGIAVTMEQVSYAGSTELLNSTNGLITSSMAFSEPSQPWLTMVPDRDGPNPLNWIRAGGDCGMNFSDYGSGFCTTGERSTFISYDPRSIYESIAGGIICPGPLAGGLFRGSGQTTNDLNMPLVVSPRSNNLTLNKIESVDIVLTSDKSKWSRCIVVEANDDPTLAVGGAKKLQVRKQASIDKNGNVESGSTGMSWFPGYAINVETGQRLNVFFSENSFFNIDNGSDMIFNPSNTVQTQAFQIRGAGQHFVYVSNTQYDECSKLFGFLSPNSPNYSEAIGGTTDNDGIHWVMYPRLADGFQMKSMADGLIPSDVSIKVRVVKPYERFRLTQENQGYPLYEFSTNEFVSEIGNSEVAKSALDLIRVVPNPYYAQSQYENSALDNRVRITNLPSVCTVSIYTTDGALIRRFSRETPDDNSFGTDAAIVNTNTTIDWDLKNLRNVPISGGMYLIHVEAPGIGEKVIKWFGVIRPVDLDTY